MGDAINGTLRWGGGISLAHHTAVPIVGLFVNATEMPAHAAPYAPSSFANDQHATSLNADPLPDATDAYIATQPAAAIAPAQTPCILDLPTSCPNCSKCYHAYNHTHICK
jgi:hypothetical protein